MLLLTPNGALCPVCRHRILACLRRNAGHLVCEELLVAAEVAASSTSSSSVSTTSTTTSKQQQHKHHQSNTATPLRRSTRSSLAAPPATAPPPSRSTSSTPSPSSTAAFNMSALQQSLPRGRALRKPASSSAIKDIERRVNSRRRTRLQHSTNRDSGRVLRSMRSSMGITHESTPSGDEDDDDEDSNSDDDDNRSSDMLVVEISSEEDGIKASKRNLRSGVVSSKAATRANSSSTTKQVDIKRMTRSEARSSVRTTRSMGPAPDIMLE
ncbi:hypothetical protein BCR33DRAFT_712736 [Rhizoclosmatium globosum]|uniref:Uncharacterized protein n=1 Tax=Rhizoclosmatium globosum TaxID=329046 RepID=A0A1Y2CUJ9_9FUNG|nr:hypothetical protein BCR33DRAFT_712736 [Rhizoclosmatium globosum]|eukprot:ORY50740.1 hypothetical protein BCR33DRAFT_712736 [Rhizoclosmatium globosum]